MFTQSYHQRFTPEILRNLLTGTTDLGDTIYKNALEAKIAGRMTTQSANKLMRAFVMRNGKRWFPVEVLNDTYLDWMKSVVDGKYDAALLATQGFGKTSLNYLKAEYANEIALCEAQYYGMYI